MDVFSVVLILFEASSPKTCNNIILQLINRFFINDYFPITGKSYRSPLAICEIALINCVGSIITRSDHYCKLGSKISKIICQLITIMLHLVQ